ncbi:hypothetical protein V5O48_012468 [Marasmius crinis-equi]|uniref:Guanine nucleotide-binding protein-like 1 n=1 Tax=Marasmius crinis-equi TaxID=585013 RepID=A0ABR3F2S6_9AGAR
MPSRKKPTSTRKKKEEQQLRRAIKRGDVEPPPPKRPQKNKKRPPNARSDPNPAAESSQKLQSSFIKTSVIYLKKTQELASTLSLQRPIPTEASIYQDRWTPVDQERLTCPSRPKWNYEMSKKEVEHNEEGWFKKWVKTTDELAAKWQISLEEDTQSQSEGDDAAATEQNPSMPPSPTRFERNLEVWRQLWRVTEISQIILVLLDSRCPLVHLPPSLVHYLSKHQVILVLTKTDICGPTRAAAWKKYLHNLYPQFPIVEVSSYAPKDQTTVHQGRAQFQPHLPLTFRQQLVGAIREIHAKMLEPPESVKSRPAALKHWRPKVKREIGWDAALVSGGDAGKVVGGAAAPKPTTEGQDEDSNEEPPFLTIGLIGQPNVGKSSLLNALFGESRVRASKTPGKTKHFQTLFWTSDIRLVDCPGLVIPNYMPMEMQVLCGVLPIARLSAIPACIHFASQLLPLEEIFGLTHPNAHDTPEEDKRTWREGMKRPDPKPTLWTAMDILVAYANKKAWLTAKAGRPDINRAGNAILRALAENKVPWSFWPPGTAIDVIEAEMHPRIGDGLWISQDQGTSSDEDDSSDGEGTFVGDEGGSLDGDSSDEDDATQSGDEDQLSETEEATQTKPPLKVGAGRFALLNIGDDSEEDENSEEEEEDDEA